MATFTINISDVDMNKDRDAALLLIEQRNQEIADHNADPANAENQLTPLPFGTNVELRDSYITELTKRVEKAHASYAEQAAKRKAKQVNRDELWKNATQAQRDAAIAALTS